ncbi:MAG: hypothetical protein PHC86_00790 [Eubacteriales bacterium]|nr:hypothetical protein [Eubacteriales bacterium]
MARFCFYCGRELATGEKCDCRVHQSTSAGSATQTKQAPPPPQAPPRPKAAPQGKAAHTTRASHTARPKSGPVFDKAAILAGVQQFVRYLARPVETIRQSVQYADPRRLLTLILLHAALSGVAALILSQLGTLDLLLQLTVAGSADNPALGAIFLAVQGFGLTLAMDLLLIIITQIALKYVFKASYSLVRVASSLSPVFFYSILFLVLALFSLTAVPISSLLMLAAGLAVSAIALYLALRQLTNFDENRCFMLVVFILIAYTSVISMLLSLATPVLTVLLDQTLPL